MDYRNLFKKIPLLVPTVRFARDSTALITDWAKRSLTPNYSEKVFDTIYRTKSWGAEH
jgi:hypothetical protein